jgi:hypothetical protein
VWYIGYLDLGGSQAQLFGCCTVQIRWPLLAYEMVQQAGVKQQVCVQRVVQHSEGMMEYQFEHT